MSVRYRKICSGLLIASAAAFSGIASEQPSAPTPLQSLLERARSGDAAAHLQMGYNFYQQNNPVRAAYWFSAAARQNLPEAQYNLGRCFMTGYGVEKNQHQAFELFRLAAQQDLPQAELMLTQFYLSGIAPVPGSNPPRPAIPPDEAKAFALLEKLSSAGNADAQTVYAEYLIKKYPEQHKHKIIALLEKSSPQLTQAKILLADYLLSRTDDLRDEKRARALLESAAEHSSEALAKLAFAVENGFGAPPDPAQAFKLYKRSLEQSFSPLAAVRLANFYYSGSFGAPQDIPQAIKLYERAAASGVPEALYKLGNCYHSGIGVKSDKFRAFELFFQAAKMNYPPAQYALAQAFESGEGTPEDQNAAFYWYNQAAVRYEPRALLETGRRYLNGKGTIKDPAKAVIFLEQALANGMNEAAPLLREARQSAADPSHHEHTLPEFGLKPTSKK
jgi:TPR repeat protein